MPEDVSSRRGFKMAKLFPVECESAIAELYFDDLIWAYVSLKGVNTDAVGEDRVKGAQVVVEFWREPDKATGVWDFNLDLDGAIRLLDEAKDWLIQNEVGRTATGDDDLGPAGQAFSKMSEDEQTAFTDPARRESE